VAAAPKPGDPIWALLPNPPGVAGPPNTAPGVLGVPKAAPGDAGTPKPPPGDPNAFPGVAPVPNAAVGVEGFAKPAQNAGGEHVDLWYSHLQQCVTTNARPQCGTKW